MSLRKNLNLERVVLDDLTVIEQIEGVVHFFPWTRQNFLDALTAGYPAFCCRVDSILVAFIFSMVVLDEIHILNITVLPDYCRQGIGSLMLLYVHQFALRKGVKVAFLEVNQNNTGALLFYRAHGYQEVGKRKGYYPSIDGGREDALILRRLLTL